MMSTITPISSIILSILLYFFFISPMYGDIKDIRTEVDIFQEAATEYDTFNKKLNQVLGIKRGQNPLTIERLNQFVPSDVDAPHVIADLESIAKGHSMLFGNISTKSSDSSLGNKISNSSGGNTQEQVNVELQTTDISFDLIGTYVQLQDFLSDIESSLTLLEVIELEFTASNGLFEQFSITVRAYALPIQTN